MQAIWRGAINFGLISIPVRLFSATEEKTLRFNMLHKEDDGRVAFNRTCKVCGKDNLTKDDLVRGFEYEKGMYVKFDDDEIDNVQIDTSHTVEVVHFTPDEQIDPIYYLQVLLPGPRRARRQGVRLAAQGARGIRQGRCGEGRDPGQGAARDAAGPGQRPRARDDVLAGRDPRSAVRRARARTSK